VNAKSQDRRRKMLALRLFAQGASFETIGKRVGSARTPYGPIKPQQARILIDDACGLLRMSRHVYDNRQISIVARRNDDELRALIAKKLKQIDYAEAITRKVQYASIIFKEKYPVVRDIEQIMARELP
jgi:hypothetical protein